MSSDGASRTGDYVRVNGTRFYYKVHGEGDPVVLLHGAWSSSESFSLQVDRLSEHFQLLLVDRRGHGRTPDTPGPYSYQQSLEDMVGVIDVLGIEIFNLVGWSAGAFLGLMMAECIPDRLNGFASIGGAFSFQGYERSWLRRFERLTTDDLPEPLIKSYERLSPDGPEHFQIVFEKIKKMPTSRREYTPDELSGISVPTLVMSGDRDIVSLEHTIKFYRSLPRAELSIIPGASHMLPMEKSALVNSHLLEFLNGLGDESEEG